MIGSENICPHPFLGPALALCYSMVPRIQCTEHAHKGLAEGNRTKLLIPLPESSLFIILSLGATDSYCLHPEKSLICNK